MKKTVVVLVVLFVSIGIGVAFAESTSRNSSDFEAVASTLDDGLVAYYPFDGNPNDYSGNGFNATVYGATLTTDREEAAGNAYHFNGHSNAIVVLDDGLKLTFPGGSDLSMSAWFYMENYNSDHTIIVAMESGINVQTRASIRVNEVGIPYYFALAFPRELYAPAPVTLNEWHHIAAVHEGETAKLYLDGMLVAEEANFGALSNPYLQCVSGSSGLPFQNTCTSLAIGAWTDWWGVEESVFPGTIDEVRVYNRPLGDDEVRLLAQVPCGASIDVLTSVAGLRAGQRLTAQAHLLNTCDEALQVEPKLWLRYPDGTLEQMRGLSRMIRLEAGDDYIVDLQSKSLLDDSISGQYEIGGRLLDPITGDHLSSDIEAIDIAP